MHHVFRTTLATLALVGTASVHAMGSDADNLHQRFLRGDASISSPQIKTAESTVVPGSNAGHLIFLGVDRQEALERAAMMGEQARMRSAASTASLPITGDDIYARNVRAAAAAAAKGMTQAMR